VIVKVVRVEGDRIKLGVQAPTDVPVHQEEIQRDIDAGKPRGGASALKAALGLPT